jgi:hypothetical protein
MKMNTIQAAAYVGLTPEVLIKMRTRITSTLNSGPPFKKEIDGDGRTIHVYLKRDLDRWMRMTCCRLTAWEAAILLGISRLEIEDLPPGIYPLPTKKGVLAIYPTKRVYVFKNNRMSEMMAKRRKAYARSLKERQKQIDEIMKKARPREITGT